MLIDRHDSEFECCTCDFSDIPIAIEVLDDLMGYSGVGTDGNPYDTPSWNAALYRDWETDRKSTRLNSSHRL